MHIYSGAIHMHSNFSDGTGKPDEIAGYADELGLDYIILTDHNTAEAKKAGYEKFYGDTMLIVGYEINDINNENHYLVFGTDLIPGKFRDIGDGDTGCELSASEYIKIIKESGGIGFIAHPYEKRNHFPQHPPFPWTTWESKDFDGIEIWNHMSEWVEGLNDKNKIQRFLHPLKTLVAPDSEAVAMWDKINLERKVSAIGSVDAHAHKQNFLGFYVEIFPYKVLFKSIRTNVILEEEINKSDPSYFDRDKRNILNALKNGNSFISNNYYGDAKGFRFNAEHKGEIYGMGEDLILSSLKDKVKLNCLVPKNAEIRLLKNGTVIDKISGTGAVWDYEGPGNYRVECWLGQIGWIFSNNIRIIEE